MTRFTPDAIASVLMILVWVAIFALWLTGRGDLIYIPAAVGGPTALFLVREAFSHSRASKIFVVFCLGLAVVMQAPEMLSLSMRGITTLLSLIACAVIACAVIGWGVLKTPRTKDEDA